MNSPMTPNVFISESGDEFPSDEVIADETHQLSIEVSESNQYACLNFSSRLAMYDFARSLLHEALYGKGGQQEFYPLEYQGKLEVINGARVPCGSARLFVFYPGIVNVRLYS